MSPGSSAASRGRAPGWGRVLPILLVAGGPTALAQQGSVALSCFPGIALADGQSTVTVTAEVRDESGRFVRDGTQVVFETDRGSFRTRGVVPTQGGFARALLTAPSVPGTARVRATVFGLAAQGSHDVEFVGDASILSSAREFIEVASPDRVVYSTQDRVLEAESDDRGVKLRYREVEVSADSLQLRPSGYDLRARGATVTVGGRTESFREVYIRLDQRRGFGFVDRRETRPVVRGLGPWIAVSLEERPTLKVVEVVPSGFREFEGEPTLSLLSFADLEEAVSTVVARKATVMPSRGIQFHRASLTVGGQAVMALPLFQLDTRSASPVVTEQFVNVSNSALAVNYPYYLELEPGRTSLLRFRYGNRFGNGLGATGGTYLDYETSWNAGAAMEGALTVTGLARDDWGVGVRQFWQPDGRTSLSAQLDFPAHRSVFANAGLNRTLGGYRLSLAGQYGRSLAGTRFSSDHLTLAVEREPQAVRGTPLSFSTGVSAYQRRFSGQFDRAQRGGALNARLDTRAIALGGSSTLIGSYTLSRSFGDSTTTGFGQGATLSLTTSPSAGWLLSSTYDYAQDGVGERILGRHRLTTESVFSAGALRVRGFLAQSLDVSRLTAKLATDFRLGPQWRLSYGYYEDRFASDVFRDQTLILGYRLGFREVGLSYSTQTRRVGIELLGTVFD